MFIPCHLYVRPPCKCPTCSHKLLGNILLLRGDIELAPGRESVTYAHMAQVLAEYLLMRAPGVDVGVVLEYMPLTTRASCSLLSALISYLTGLFRRRYGFESCLHFHHILPPCG
jgi:hypothetical protein